MCYCPFLNPVLILDTPNVFTLRCEVSTEWLYTVASLHSMHWVVSDSKTTMVSETSSANSRLDVTVFLTVPLAAVYQAATGVEPPAQIKVPHRWQIVVHVHHFAVENKSSLLILPSTQHDYLTSITKLIVKLKKFIISLMLPHHDLMEWESAVVFISFVNAEEKTLRAPVMWKSQQGVRCAASQGQTKRESEGHFYWYFSHRVMETHVEFLGYRLQQHPPTRQKTGEVKGRWPTASVEDPKQSNKVELLHTQWPSRSWWALVSSGHSSSLVYTETRPHVPWLAPGPSRRQERSDAPAGGETSQPLHQVAVWWQRNGTHPGWQALLKGSTDGEAAVVEVSDELWVDGAAWLGHLSVGRGDEDALHCFHQDIVEQRVFCTSRQSDAKWRMDRWITFKSLSDWVGQQAESNFLSLTSWCCTFPHSPFLWGSSSGCPGEMGWNVSASESVNRPTNQ